MSNQSHLNAQGSDQHERSSRNKAFGLEPCFHFNNRKYADDDLIVGSVNPLELFLIFAELDAGGDHTVGPGGIRLTIDQSHNVEAKVEAMVLSVLNLQDAYAKSLLIDRAGLAQAQADGDVLRGHELLIDAYSTDVRPLCAQARENLGAAADPIRELRAGGYITRITRERTPTTAPAGVGE